MRREWKGSIQIKMQITAPRVNVNVNFIVISSIIIVVLERNREMTENGACICIQRGKNSLIKRD